MRSLCICQSRAMTSWVFPSAKTGIVMLAPSSRAAATAVANRTSSLALVNPWGNGAFPRVVSMSRTSIGSSGKRAPVWIVWSSKFTSPV